MPKVSIIVPVYKVEKYLNRCLDSIIAQIFTDCECILIDNSGKIYDKFASKNYRFVVIYQENASLLVDRNAGMDIIRVEFFCFIANDDVITLDYIVELYTMIKEDDSDFVKLRKILDLFFLYFNFIGKCIFCCQEFLPSCSDVSSQNKFYAYSYWEVA